jgi:hypothetical protein
MKPRRSAGLIVLLKLPMCSTRPAMIERCKSRSRPSFQLQFAQVIVLDDPGFVAPSPVEQCKPSRARTSSFRAAPAGRILCHDWPTALFFLTVCPETRFTLTHHSLSQHSSLRRSKTRSRAHQPFTHAARVHEWCRWVW